MIKQVLNRHGFEVDFHNLVLYHLFPDCVLQTKLPWGYKIPKFLNFSWELEESTVKHVAHYQIECGDITTNEYLIMKCFSSSLTKNAFTWFTTLSPNSILNWDQLERTFHEQFFRGETRVSLIDLINIWRFHTKSIDDYLNRLRRMKETCYT